MSHKDHDAWRDRIEQLTHLPVAELAHRLEVSAADEEAWLALLLIAQKTEETLLERSIQARLWLYRQHAGQLLTWINQHPWRALFSHQGEQTELLNRVFARILETLHIEHFQLPDMQVLPFMKMTVHAVIADEMRAYQLQQNVEVFVQNGQVHDDTCSISVTSLLQLLQAEFPGERETVLLYLAYIRGMKPSEISSQYKQLFPSVEDVLRLKQDILERLRSKTELQEHSPESSDWTKWGGG